MDVKVDRALAARHGLNAGDIHDAIMATAGGIAAAVTLEGRERYEVNVRYPRELRDNLDRLRQIAIPTMSGSQIPLGQIATIGVVQGPMAVKTENAFPVTTVYVDIAGTDIGSYVQVAPGGREPPELPAGYTISWFGQFEFMARVKEKLKLVVARNARTNLPPSLSQLSWHPGVIDRDALTAFRAGRGCLVDLALGL